MTLPQWDASAFRPESDVLYEVVNGQRVELPPMGTFECWVASRLIGALNPFCSLHGLGRAVVESLFLLDEKTKLQRRPDVAFVSYDRWPKDRKLTSDNAWAVVPDLAIEVVSPSNTFPEVVAKVREYCQFGCKLVWVVVPSEEKVYVYRSPTEVRILSATDMLQDETLLPSFQMSVAELFQQ
jgi:Uma2 family endonuclease